MQATMIRSALLSGPALAQRPQRPIRRQPLVLVRAGGEGSGEPAPAPQKPSGTAYIDELNAQDPPRTEMSAEMKARLKREYYSLGGAPNTKMGQNWFLNISLFIAFLAVLSALTGAL